ncbi:MAG: FAD-dependent oxidoreductase, partial [Deltaproteobacteria bacterium]|nr:FAD-dependent oxidoreductase [Deltaproteobacteria bacterium]
MVLMINGLTLALGEGEQKLSSRVATLLNLPVGDLDEVRIVRRSIDARRARPPRFVYQVRVCLR